MTTTVNEPELASSRYVPEGFTAHINSTIHWPWPEGTTQPDVRAAEEEIMRTVIEVAELFTTDQRDAAAALVAEKLPTLPAEWSPLLYFEAVARQMALPVWEEYTETQKCRAYQYAAKYVRARLLEWLRPARAHAVGAPEDEKFLWRDQPKAVYWAYLAELVHKTEYRRRLTQMQAYLATHPDDEVQPAQLRAITGRWGDYKQAQAFF